MGDVSDMEDLFRLAKRDRRRKLIWAICTSLGTIVATTATVSWKMSRYVADLEHATEEMRHAFLVMDKKVEAAESEAAKAVADARDAKVTADKALLYAQLTGRKP